VVYIIITVTAQLNALLVAGHKMIGVKLFLYVVYTTLLVVDITCIADDGSGLVASGEGSGGSAEGSAEPTCKLNMDLLCLPVIIVLCLPPIQQSIGTQLMNSSS